MNTEANLNEAQTSSYPDPEALLFDPYPTLTQSSFPLVQEGYVPQDGSSPPPGIQYETSPGPSMPYESFVDSIGGLSEDEEDEDEEERLEAFEQHFQPADYDDPRLPPGDGHNELQSGGRLIDNDFLSFGASRLPENESDFELEAALDSLSDDDDILDSQSEDDIEASILDRTQATQRGRPRGRGGASRRGRRGWKWAVKGTEHDKLFEKPKREIRRKGRGGPSRRGRRKGKQRLPGPEFKMHMKKATSSFMERNLESALNHARNAVQADPEMYSGHALISDILEAQGRKRDSLGALLAGAHTRRDAETWMMCADKTLELTNEELSEADLQQMLYCYMKALAIDKTSPEIRQCRRDVYIKLKSWRSAERDCQSLLRMRPYDLDDIQVFGFVATSQMYSSHATYTSVRKAYEAAFDYYAQQADHGIPALDLWTHLNIYLEFMEKVASTADSIRELKRRARWILGRHNETFWDAYMSDDREFDEYHQPRRVHVPEFERGIASIELEKYGQGLLLQIRMKLGFFRLKMGDNHEAFTHLMLFMRFKDDREALESMFDWMWEIAETLRRHELPAAAVQFYEPMQLVLENFHDPSQYWMNLARCYCDIQQYDKAEQCYASVLDSNRAHINALAAMARMYELSGQLEAARPLVSQVIALGHARALERHKVDWRPAVEKTIAPRKDKLSRAQKAVSEKSKSKTMDKSAQPNAETTRKEKPRKLPAASTLPKTASISRNNSMQKSGRPSKDRKAEFWKTQASRVRQTYNSLRETWPRTTKDPQPGIIEEWMRLADGMCDEFRSMSFFYPRREKMQRFTGYSAFLSRGVHANLMAEMKAMQARLETGSEEDDMAEEVDDLDPNLPQDFHGIPFVTWHRIFIELAVLHAHRANQERCYWLLDAARWGNVFYFSKTFKNTTRAAQLHCSLVFNDSETLTTVCREYVQAGEGWAGMPTQFLAAFSRLNHYNKWFSASMTQKFLLRQVKQLDFPHLPPEWKPHAEHASLSQRGTMNMKVERLIKAGHNYPELDPGVLVMYGHMIAASNHSAGSLPYYYRAFALQPDNPCVVLSLGLIHLQNAMKRVSDHRQYDMVQGITFIQRYYEVRAATGRAYHLQEAEYNLGRTWHMLSLTPLAVERYEKALQLSDRVQEEIRSEAAGPGIEIEDYSCEAALAMRDIFAMTGNALAAREITERWLVI